MDIKVVLYITTYIFKYLKFFDLQLRKGEKKRTGNDQILGPRVRPESREIFIFKLILSKC